ncbi:hypothetical protein [Methylobacterium sp. J-070]|uniref:hypothetical protein n=1 Tax=Methylobacterium sp. J-070 TaxID=2836650 RepID=UPI001FBB1352|nr:hypothetical protein [Methylobacterium sp. J-070]MCJ2051039.1 hypothetical protein [Methylobacterium sp. J-070]
MLMNLRTKIYGTIFIGIIFYFIMVRSAEPDRAALQRIADALGVPVERFFTDSLPVNADGCLYLWSRIRTAEGRQRALEALRAIADEEPA